MQIGTRSSLSCSQESPTDAQGHPSTAGRRKRSAGSPELGSSEMPMGAGEPSGSKSRGPSSKHAGSNPPSATPDVASTENSSYPRARRTSRKEKELSQELDRMCFFDVASLTRGRLITGIHFLAKNKHANQYTYRAPKTTQTPIKRPGPSTSASGPGHDHGTRRNPPQSRVVASPSPVPLSWNVPDHLSHLTPLLPTPSPVGVNVNVGGDVKVVEKGVRVRWPGKRTTIGEMRRRVRGMMEFVARAQLEAGERERRVGMLKTALSEVSGPGPSSKDVVDANDDAALPLGAELDVTMAEPDTESVDVKPITSNDPITDVVNTETLPKIEDTDTSLVPFPTGNQPLGTSTSTPLSLPPIESAQLPSRSLAQSTEPPTPISRTTPPPQTQTRTRSQARSATPQLPQLPTVSTTQLLDELTRELIQFQERFGAAKDGKVYRDRTERERRTRGGGGTSQGDGLMAGYSL